MIKSVTFDQHRWYTVVVIEHDDGTVEKPVIGAAFPGEGPSKFSSYEAFMRAVDGDDEDDE